MLQLLPLLALKQTIVRLLPAYVHPTCTFILVSTRNIITTLMTHQMSQSLRI